MSSNEDNNNLPSAGNEGYQPTIDKENILVIGGYKPVISKGKHPTTNPPPKKK